MTWTFPAALLSSLALTPVVRQLLLRSDVVDRPNVRSSHRTVTARGGGIAVVVATLAAVAISSIEFGSTMVGLAGAAVVLGGVGFADDRFGLGAVPRLSAQLVVPAVALPLLVSGGLPGGARGALLAGLAVFWSIGYVNAFNFMDGINGISVVQAVTAGLSFALIGEWHDLPILTAGGLAIAGACAGFGPFNVWRASIFLGDVGSYFIGSWLASLLIVAVADGVAPTVAIGPFLLYIADTATTVIRRARRGERLISAHREHAYQRLVRRGWTHLQVSGLAGVVIAATSGSMLATESSPPAVRAAAFAASVALVLSFTALPATLQRRNPTPVS